MTTAQAMTVIGRNGPEMVSGSPEFFAQWVAHQLDIPIEEFGDYAAGGIVLDGRLIGGLVYNEYRIQRFGKTMQISIATTSPRWCTRKVLRSLFGYPFQQMGVTRLWAAARRKNTQSRSLMERLGFKYEGMARKGYDGIQDSAIYAMLPHECDWIR